MSKLSPKQQAFIEYYLQHWNASRAAELAGYNGKSNVVGPRLLANVSIKEAIQIRLSELKMSANEVLTRLTDIARGDIAEFVDIDYPEDLKDRSRTHIIKKFIKKQTSTKDGGFVTTTELEMYPADNALIWLGKHHALFTDKIEHTGDVDITVKVIKGVSMDDL